MPPSPRNATGADLAAAADIAAAMSHPLRLRLCERLLTGACCVGEAVACCDADQPTVSRHLAILRRAGVVRRAVDGRRRIYELVAPEQTRALLTTLKRMASAAADATGG